MPASKASRGNAFGAIHSAIRRWIAETAISEAGSSTSGHNHHGASACSVSPASAAVAAARLARYSGRRARRQASLVMMSRGAAMPSASASRRRPAPSSQ